MQRRQALKSFAALSALAATARAGLPAAAQETTADANGPWIRKTLKIGMIGVKGSLEDKFRAAQQAGFDGVELNVPGIDVQEVKAAIEATGFIVDGSVVNSHWNIRHTDPDAAVRAQALADLKQGLEQTAAVGGDSVLLVAGHGKDGSAEEVYQRATENIRQALPIAQQHSVPILIENVWNHFLYDHQGGADQSAQPLADFIDQFDSPWIGVQFDLGNHWKYGDVAQWVKTLGPRIKKLDIKGFSRADGKFTKITEGDIDWPAVEAALREIGYRGWCAAEVGGGDLNRLREIAQHMEEALHCSQTA
ncbi:sugar phosphate isomerase/epimerase [Roseiconus nitratireducens]|uniref:Sugar phosphate isomerase/epimerase n=1 Tax=Roseiconus nitratireducens TaxID=2605748 RepID=A0A5M6DG40_9BACT|nr:sugar phosphate isomerase/epimerase family protein [Roseiconus nitratireducens]KAA5545270.1 sugar phosphate isomerase/epimerase [Roseiconus nitratireducens]